MRIISIFLALFKAILTIIKYLLLKIIDKLINFSIILLLMYLGYRIINYYLF